MTLIRKEQGKKATAEGGGATREWPEAAIRKIEEITRS